MLVASGVGQKLYSGPSPASGHSTTANRMGAYLIEYLGLENTPQLSGILELLY